MVYPRENLIISYFQLFLLLLLLTTITSGDEFIDNDRLVTVRCQKNDSKVSENYTRNVDYVVAHINISKEDQGFKNATYSSNGSSADTVYSLVQCRGDLTDANCSTCLSNIASINMSAVCPGDNTTGAVVLREKCSFKYSDQVFFGKIDGNLDHGYYPFCSGVDYHVNRTDQLKNLLDSLVTNSTDAATKKMYAIGSNTTTNGTVEAIAECRRDLAVADCKNCLTNATTSLVQGQGNCSAQTTGNYFLGASCNVRFAWNGSNVNN